ncbi:MAG: hypothetical protein QM733_16145 [Ilumatobacteraceae bacterium]
MVIQQRDGQLPAELRSRALSGFPSLHLVGLADLIGSIGGLCLASGPTAAALRHCDGYVLRPPFHVMIEHGRNVRRLGHVVHVTRELPLIDRGRVGTIPVLSGTRTIIDLARSEPRERLAVAIDSALRDGGTSEDFLFRRIGELRSSGRYGIPALIDVLEGNEVTRGGQTWLEREVLRLIDAAGLPRPETQAVLTKRQDKLVRVDFHFAGTPIVVEALGYRWHRTGVQMQVDAARLNQLQLDGYLVLQVTYDAVVTGATEMLGQLSAALARWRRIPA